MTDSKFVRATDGTLIAYRVYGDGPLTVLLSNGIGCNQIWIQYLIDALAARHRVVVWDYRGHVDSDVPADPRMMTMDNCVQDMLAVMAEDGIDRCVLVGFSMGVQVSLEFYSRYPERVLGLVLLAGPYEYPFKTIRRFGRVLKYGFPVLRAGLRVGLEDPLATLWKFVVGGPWSFLSAKYLVLNSGAYRREDFDEYHPHITNIDLNVLLQTAAYIGEHTAVSVLPRVAVPTLIIAGDTDNFCPVALSEEMHRMIRDSELIIVPGGTHAVLVEFPDLVNPKVLGFLSKHWGRRRRADAIHEAAG